MRVICYISLLPSIVHSLDDEDGAPVVQGVSYGCSLWQACACMRAPYLTANSSIPHKTT